MVRFLILIVSVSLLFVAHANTCNNGIGPAVGGLCPVGYVDVSGTCCDPSNVVNVECKYNLGPAVAGLCPVGYVDVSGTCCDSSNVVNVECKNNLGPPIFGSCPTGYRVINGVCCPLPVKCEDKLTPSGINDCPRLVSFCYNANYKDLMKDQCSKTCKFC